MPTQVDTTITATSCRPCALSRARCVITPTPTGTNSSDRWLSKKLAAGATAACTGDHRKASSKSTMPTTGPGTGNFRKWESASPPDCMSNKNARPCKGRMGKRQNRGQVGVLDLPAAHQHLSGPGAPVQRGNHLAGVEQTGRVKRMLEPEQLRVFLGGELHAHAAELFHPPR